MNTINWIGLRTLYTKEVRRFLKVYNQTLVAPAITALLFLAVFSLALHERVQDIAGVPFQQFMAAGLIMMTVVQQAFANTSSSLIMGKVLGSIIDYLMPPISAGEMVLAMAGAAVTRGFMVGLLVALCVGVFVPLEVHNFALVLFYITAASLMMALLGIVAGIFAETFDHMAGITSYIITPLSFLSGTFYSVKNLPEFWQTVNHFNPFFYMIDGFRYSMTGHSDASVGLGMAVLVVANTLLYITAYIMLKTGYRIKN